MTVIPTLGTVLAVSTDGGSSYTNVAQVESLDGPGLGVRFVDSTNLDSTDAEKIVTGLREGRPCSGSIQYDPEDASHAILIGLYTTPAIASWRLTFVNASASTLTFSGILEGFEPTGIEVDGKLMADFNIEITGQIVVGV